MTIAIIEDDKSLREELTTTLENNGYTVLPVEQYQDFSSFLHADLLLLDIQLPDTNGIYLLKEIRKQSNIPILMVTSRNTEMDELICMSYGADDYITKPYNPQILLLRIEAILKRLHFSPQVYSYQSVRLNPAKGVIETSHGEITLSKNELRMFLYLIEHVGTIVSREEIMRYLWDSEEFIDDNTLTVNMNRLRNRLEEAGLKDVIETRRGQGYLLK